MKALIALLLAGFMALWGSWLSVQSFTTASSDASDNLSMEQIEDSENVGDKLPETPVDPQPEPEPEPEPEAPGTSQPQTPSADPMIGNLYTKSQILALNNTQIATGGGGQKDEKNRPIYSLNTQTRFEKYDAHFIGKDDNHIYLTYDCGYEHQKLTAKTLDILKEKNVKAIFFVDQHFAKANPGLIRRIIDEGHILGNHGARHENMVQSTPESAQSNIMDLHNYILQNFGYTMTYFRPPYGYYSERVLAITQSLGYITVNYDFAYKDWVTDAQPSDDYALQTITASAHSGAIYMLHAVSSANANILSTAIDQIRQSGYEFFLFQP